MLVYRALHAPPGPAWPYKSCLALHALPGPAWPYMPRRALGVYLSIAGQGKLEGGMECLVGLLHPVQQLHHAARGAAP